MGDRCVRGHPGGLGHGGWEFCRPVRPQTGLHLWRDDLSGGHVRHRILPQPGNGGGVQGFAGVGHRMPVRGFASHRRRSVSQSPARLEHGVCGGEPSAGHASRDHRRRTAGRLDRLGVDIPRPDTFCVDGNRPGNMGLGTPPGRGCPRTCVRRRRSGVAGRRTAMLDHRLETGPFLGLDVAGGPYSVAIGSRVSGHVLACRTDGQLAGLAGLSAAAARIYSLQFEYVLGQLGRVCDLVHLPVLCGRQPGRRCAYSRVNAGHIGIFKHDFLRSRRLALRPDHLFTGGSWGVSHNGCRTFLSGILGYGIKFGARGPAGGNSRRWAWAVPGCDILADVEQRPFGPVRHRRGRAFPFPVLRKSLVSGDHRRNIRLA